MMISRRVFLGGSACLMLAPVPWAQAQQGKKGPRIALVFANVPEAAIKGTEPDGWRRKSVLGKDARARLAGWRKYHDRAHVDRGQARAARPPHGGATHAAGGPRCHVCRKGAHPGGEASDRIHPARVAGGPPRLDCPSRPC